MLRKWKATAFARWIRESELSLLAFVVTVLIGLSATPLLFDQAIQPHRAYIEEVVQPTREAVRTIDSRLTEEVALSRGYLLTEDTSFLRELRETQAEQRETLEDLRRRAIGIEDPAVRLAIARLEDLVAERHEPATELSLGEITAEEYVSRLSARQELLARTTGTVRRLGDDLVELERSEREEIRTLRRYQGRTLGILVLLAGFAVVASGRVAVQLRRRTQQETAMRRIASAMNAAYDLDEIASFMMVNATELLNTDVVLVERADPDRKRVEISAQPAEAIGAQNTTADYPGALADYQRIDGGPRRFERLVSEATPTGLHLRPSYAEYSGAIFPMMSDWGAMGALVALREPGRPPLSDPEMRRGEILADLGALAMRKLYLLERSQLGWERASHLLEARSRLIRGLSHDLRNPLGAILGFAEILKGGMRGELTEDQRDSIGRIQQAAGAMDQLIQHLVDIGRSESTEIPVKPEPIDIGELVRELAEEHRGQADQSGLDLGVQIEENLPIVEADPIHIRTVLGNLLSNALKYTSAGRIDVRAEQRGALTKDGPNSLAIAVIDTGHGIPPERRETVFEEFSRLRADLAPGEGIGLASSRLIARRLGGELILESSHPERGSTFVLLLPVTSDPIPSPEGHPTA